MENQEILAALNPQSSFGDMSEEQLRTGVLRLMGSGYDDARILAEDNAQAKAAKKVAKLAAAQKADLAAGRDSLAAGIATEQAERAQAQHDTKVAAAAVKAFKAERKLKKIAKGK